MFKDPAGVSRSVASPIGQAGLPEHLYDSLVEFSSNVADAKVLNSWLDELLDAALSRSTDPEVRQVLRDARVDKLSGRPKELAKVVLAALVLQLDNLQVAVETLEGCQDLLLRDE